MSLKKLPRLVAPLLACACLLVACSAPSGDSDHAADTAANTVPDGTPAESIVLTEPESNADTAPESDEATEESPATETETETETNTDGENVTVKTEEMEKTEEISENSEDIEK